MKPVDIIIPYILGPDNGLELKYALRSIERNFQHDKYRVIVVGNKPDWLANVKHLAFERIPEQKNRNFTDQLLKLYSALTELDATPSFIWTYDDVYFTRPVKLADIKQLKAVASFDRYPHHLDNSGAQRNWRSTMDYTMQQVVKKGGSNYNYETHLPRYFTKSRILKLIDSFDLLSRPMMISSLYYNYYHKDKQPLCLYENNPGIRFLLRNTFDVPTLKKHISRHLFTNNDPRTWNPLLKRVLLEMFPEKSKFEL
jgi:hypothetical protein